MIEIEQALLTSFINADFGLPIAYENLPFEPVIGTAYTEPFVLQNDITPLTLSDTDQTDGVFRVLLNYPVDVGAIVPKQMAAEVFSAFSIGSKHTYNGVSTTILTNQIDRGIAQSGWFTLNLSMRFKTYLMR